VFRRRSFTRLTLRHLQLTGEVGRLFPSGPAPSPRAYHTFTAVGHICLAVGGRLDGALLKASLSVATYDAEANRWTAQGAAAAAGAGATCCRSSHRASSVPGGVLIFGGMVGKKGSAKERERLNDLALLQVPSSGGGRLTCKRFTGRCASSPVKAIEAGDPGAAARPAGRTGHVQEALGDAFFVFGGYSDGRKYTADAWKTVLPTAALGKPAVAAPVAKVFSPPEVATADCSDSTAPAEGTQWKSARRLAEVAAPPEKRRRVDAVQQQQQEQQPEQQQQHREEPHTQGRLLQAKAAAEAEIKRLRKEVRGALCPFFLFFCTSAGAPVCSVPQEES
jgi:hypothetical protein